MQILDFRLRKAVAEERGQRTEDRKRSQRLEVGSQRSENRVKILPH